MCESRSGRPGLPVHNSTYGLWGRKATFEEEDDDDDENDEVLLGTEIPGDGGRKRLYLTLHCHHPNDSCIQMGSNESRFNVSLTVRGRQSHETVSTNHKQFRKRERRAQSESNRGPSAYQPITFTARPNPRTNRTHWTSSSVLLYVHRDGDY